MAYELASGRRTHTWVKAQVSRGRAVCTWRLLNNPG